MKINTKTILLLAVPILMLFVLVVPYKYANQEVIVEWLGCGCTQLDESGNLIENNFNANDFSRVFWAVIAVVATVISFFVSKKAINENKLIRIAYVALTFVLSSVLSYMFVQSMLWC